MDIESVPFIVFQSLTCGTHALSDADNHGCAWFVTTDRRAAGRIYLDPDSGAFGISVLHLGKSRWQLNELFQLHGRYEDAEVALLKTMRLESGKKQVTVKEVPNRLKFGKRPQSEQSGHSVEDLLPVRE